MNQHNFGTFHPGAASAAGPHYHQQHQRSQPQPPHRPPGVRSPTLRDVLNGRGQGVQRHPGNVKYRTLVFVNKGLYAKCPRSDKIKISKGIVAAVRELGGRFLELDERSGIYHDIGDKKATEKTSQALREGQTKIRKQMYNDEKKAGGAQTYDTTLLAWAHSAATAPASNLTSGVGREISAEGYFGYSVQVLESLHLEDENASTGARSRSARPQTIAPNVPSDPAALAPAPSGDANAAAIARALEQFPGAATAPPLPAPGAQATNGMQPPTRRQSQPALAGNGDQSPPSEMRPSLGRFTNELGRPSLGRLTNMSMSSIFSISQMVESARNESDRQKAEGRGSVASMLSDEIRDLIRLSEPQLVQVEHNHMNIDEVSHVDKEVSVLFDEDTMKDRVSELRFTDMSRDVGAEPSPRLTDSTRSTDYARTSLMDASMMTIGTEDMSLLTNTDKRKRRSTKGKSDERETAGLLLRLSAENQGRV